MRVNLTLAREGGKAKNTLDLKEKGHMNTCSSQCDNKGLSVIVNGQF